MGNKQAPPFIVVKDTREQDGYFFKPLGACQGCVNEKLDTGDYTIQGLENVLCIERKGSVEELALNMGKDKRRFLDELERMAKFEHKFIVLEFSFSDLYKFPENSRIPVEERDGVRITGKYMLKTLFEFALYNDVHILFCGDKYNAFLMVNSILKRVNEKYTVGRV